jgi:hypothetical protein
MTAESPFDILYRLRVFYRIDEAERMVRILAVGIKERNRLCVSISYWKRPTIEPRAPAA